MKCNRIVGGEQISPGSIAHGKLGDQGTLRGPQCEEKVYKISIFMYSLKNQRLDES